MKPFEDMKEKLQKLVNISYHKTIDGTHYAATRDVAYHSVLELIEQIEKEYNNGWIPCSERLPEESLNSVIGWDEYRKRCVFVQYIRGEFQIAGKDDSFNITA